MPLFLDSFAGVQYRSAGDLYSGAPLPKPDGFVGLDGVAYSGQIGEHTRFRAVFQDHLPHMVVTYVSRTPGRRINHTDKCVLHALPDGGPEVPIRFTDEITVYHYVHAYKGMDHCVRVGSGDLTYNPTWWYGVFEVEKVAWLARANKEIRQDNPDILPTLDMPFDEVGRMLTIAMASDIPKSIGILEASGPTEYGYALLDWLKRSAESCLVPSIRITKKNLRAAQAAGLAVTREGDEYVVMVDMFTGDEDKLNEYRCRIAKRYMR